MIFTNILMIFGIKKIDHFDPYCWLLLTMLLMTGFVVQGPKLYFGVELFL